MVHIFYVDPVNQYVDTSPGGIVHEDHHFLPILDKSETMTVSEPEQQMEGQGVSRSSERYMKKTNQPFKDLQTMLSKDTSKKYISFGKL